MTKRKAKKKRKKINNTKINPQNQRLPSARRKLKLKSENYTKPSTTKLKLRDIKVGSPNLLKNIKRREKRS
jgi:hypothetical protein